MSGGYGFRRTRLCEEMVVGGNVVSGHHCMSRLLQEDMVAERKLHIQLIHITVG